MNITLDPVLCFAFLDEEPADELMAGSHRPLCNCVVYCSVCGIRRCVWLPLMRNSSPDGGRMLEGVEQK